MREDKGVELVNETSVVGILLAFADADADVRLDLLPATPAVFSNVI